MVAQKKISKENFFNLIRKEGDDLDDIVIVTCVKSMQHSVKYLYFWSIFQKIKIFLIIYYKIMHILLKN